MMTRPGTLRRMVVGTDSALCLWC
uniref:Uncharacterized protein n=1 Tax=Arundo donax TaxID=35708 RepID=A0A0A9BVR8_ARUDO